MEKRLTDNEIIKVLECCIGDIEGKNCFDCPLYEIDDCQAHMYLDALDLIKRLQSKNEDLFYKLTGVMHSVDKWLDGDELKQDEVNRAATMREKTLQIVENLQSENERLEKETKDKERAYNDEFCLRKEWKTKCQELLEEKQNNRSEAYKECIEKVKNYIKTHCNPYGKPDFDYDTSIKILNFIDNLVKEMEGEEIHE